MTTPTTDPKHVDLRPEKFTLDVENMPAGLFGSLRMHWIDASNDKVEANLDCGAGLGSPTIEMSMTYRGRRVRARADIRPLFTAWINSARKQIDEAETPQLAWLRLVREVLVAEDGNVMDVALDDQGLPERVEFYAFNEWQRLKIKNRAEQQEFTIEWGPKMSGVVVSQWGK